ncbi:flagellar hook-length control protein FliK [Sporohalobacter salinus]|uniref:flagellar hook-length control protein FliK n=1 Tax=Sporohalobacter salinus TaxID=1494606 RepID=UPI00195F5F7C|nr:flagellar hook-length control protein FliK [Sporohalobacter salinus]MBM7623519.1 flagellar hook-length control protein FliK [Sporohalobacter salinus]
MEAAQLLQLNSNSQSAHNSSHRMARNKKANKKPGSSFLNKLENAALNQKDKQKVKELLSQNSNSEELKKLQKLLDKDSDVNLSSTELKKLFGEDSNLKLTSKELHKLQKLLAKDGIEITEEELKELFDSIGSIYQQLMKLNVNQLSSLSEAEKTKLKNLKTKLLTTAKEFELQLKKLKEIGAGQLKLLDKLSSDQQQSIKNRKNLEAVKKFKENLLQKLAELKKLASKMQKQRSTFGLKGNQQNQRLQQISKLLKQLTNSDSKLSKLLQKYGITGDQIEVKQKNQQVKVGSHQSFNNKEPAKDNTLSDQQPSKEQLKSKESQSDKSLLKQLLESQNKETSEKKVRVRLSSDKQKLKEESFNAAKIRVEDQMRAKNNVVRQNIVNSKFMNVNGNLQRVDQTKVVSQVLQQLEQLKSLGKNELTLKLKPDSLGKVNLKMAISDGVLTTKVMAENYQVKKAIEAQLHQLKNALTEKNLEVGEMVVEVGSEEDFSSFQEQESFNQQGFSGRQQSNKNQQRLDPELLEELGKIEEPIEVDSVVESSLEIDSIDYVI